MRHAHAGLGRGLEHASLGLVDGLHAVGDVVDLAITGELRTNGRGDDVWVVLPHRHLDGEAPRRRRHDQAHVAHAAHRHLHGARDGRGREREHVDLLAHVLELLLVLDAEALLLVDDDEAQVVRVHVGGEQAVGAHEDAHLATRKALEGKPLLLGRAEAREHVDLEVERREAVEERLEVLLREDRRGAEHHDLTALGDALEGGAQGHLRLAEAHVTAKQAVHRTGGLHVGLDIRHGGALILRELVGELRLHVLLLGRVRREGKALNARTTRVEVDEVEGEAAGVLASLAGGTAPVRGVEAREARRGTVRTNIARDAVDLLKRYEELVSAGVFEQEVVAFLAGDLLAHDVGEERDAVRGVDDVVSGLEREGHARGIDAAARLALGGANREVSHGEDRETRRRHDDAGGDGQVSEGHLATREVRRARKIVRGRVHHRHAILRSGAQRLAKGDALVAKGEFEVLARRTVRHGEQHGSAVVQKLADAPEQARVRASDARLPHGQLRCDLGAHAQHAGERKPLLAAEVEVTGSGVEPCRLLAGVGRKLGHLVRRAHAVVKEGARLGKAHEGALTDVLERTRRLAVEGGEIALECGVRASRLDELEISGDLGARLGIRPQRLARAGDRLVRKCQLSARAHGHAVEVADGLASGGDHAPHAIDLVAEELDAHRRAHLSGMDVNRVAVDVEGARAVELARIGVAEAHEQGPDLLEGNLVTHREGAARPVARPHGRHAAKQRAGARHDEAGVAGRQAPYRLATSSDDGPVRRLRLPGEVTTLGVATDDVSAEPCREGLGRAIRRLLARDHEQARARISRPDARQHERTSTLGDCQRGVVSGSELGERREKFRRGKQLSRDSVDKH